MSSISKSSISKNFFRSALLAFGIVAMFAACSADSQENTESEDRMAVGKADHFGSCENSCDGQSESGSCWCDDLCSEYGDCCDDAAAQCDVNECDAAGDTGCAQGEFCRPGLCLYFCPTDDFDCCTANTCQKSTPTCPDLSPPPPDFCVNGESPEAVIDQDGCVVGFECPEPVQDECGDGTVPLCAIWVPECADGLVREVINYCYGDCVDPETCLAN